MGYSITEAQHQKLLRYQDEGRQCAMSTGRGGCFNRATIKNLCQSFSYKLDEGEARESVHTLCKRHAHEAGTEHVNFRVLSQETF